MNPIEMILGKLYEQRSYRSHSRNLGKRLKLLREAGRLISNPRKQIIRSYPALYKQQDSFWADYCYSINGIVSDSYIPLRAYYLAIEPTLNHRLMVSTLKDKNFYDLFFKSIESPKVLLRRINGFLYKGDYQPIDNITALDDSLAKLPAFILKASLDSGSGQSIFLFKNQAGVFKSEAVLFDNDFLREHKFDFVIQEFVKQHEYFAQFNPSSNNTIRVLTYRSVVDDSINVLHVLLRIGAKGSFLDHDNHGGVAIGIDHFARLGSGAYDSKGNIHKVFNGIVFADQSEVPFYKEITESARTIAAQSYYGRLLALDFTVSSHGQILLLDVNCWRNGISQYQYINGTLFGQFTKEVLDYCVQNPSFNIIRIPIQI